MDILNKLEQKHTEVKREGIAKLKMKLFKPVYIL